MTEIEFKTRETRAELECLEHQPDPELLPTYDLIATKSFFLTAVLLLNLPLAALLVPSDFLGIGSESRTKAIGFTITVTEKTWSEVGEMTRDNCKTWMAFFEMKLEKQNDSEGSSPR